jgi:hypothetical protein
MAAMFVSRSCVPPFVAWLLAAFFLLAQATALAHEYDHELHKHDAPCAQHFFAGNTEAGAAASTPLPLAPAIVAVSDLLPTHDLPSRTTAAYHGRAPPRAV